MIGPGLGTGGVFRGVQLHTIRARLTAVLLNKAERRARAHAARRLGPRCGRHRGQGPDREVQARLELVFATFLRLRSAAKVLRSLNEGQRPPGCAPSALYRAYIFAAARPATGEDFALVLPWVCAAAMNTFLAGFTEIVPADTHVVMILDQAGWHRAKDLILPGSLTLVPPAGAPVLLP